MARSKTQRRENWGRSGNRRAQRKHRQGSIPQGPTDHRPPESPTQRGSQGTRGFCTCSPVPGPSPSCSDSTGSEKSCNSEPRLALFSRDFLDAQNRGSCIFQQSQLTSLTRLPQGNAGRWLGQRRQRGRQEGREVCPRRPRARNQNAVLSSLGDQPMGGNAVPAVPQEDTPRAGLGANRRRGPRMFP